MAQNMWTVSYTHLSSTNAPRVPEPSSRDTTVMSPLAALTIVVKAVAPITAAAVSYTHLLPSFRLYLMALSQTL